MSAFWEGFEKRAASMSGIPGVRSGASRLGKITTPPVGVMTQPKITPQPLATPKPVKAMTTAAATPAAPKPTKVHVPKPDAVPHGGVSEMKV